MLLCRILPLAALLTLTGCGSPHASAPATLGKLMVQRLGWMDKVAKVKQARSLPIADPAREAQLLAAMEKLGAKSGLPAQPVRQFFTGQINAAKQRQQEWLAQHSTGPKPTTENLPDLAQTVRPALDSIGSQMIAALAAARRSGHPELAVNSARLQLTRAHYSEKVIAPALEGLQAALEPQANPVAR